MSLGKIHLKKILRIFYAPANLWVRLLRDDIRTDIKVPDDDDDGGGDFHGPFWADAKDHALGLSDLHEQTDLRLAANKSRGRLYPELRDGFLTYWNEKRRWHNEPLLRPDITPKAQLVLDGLGIVKVESLLAVESDGGFRRLVCPYFGEKPVLPDEGGRIGLWAMSKALTKQDVQDMRILDVLRSRSFTVSDYPLKGDEEEVFHRRYAAALADWTKLREEYP